VLEVNPQGNENWDVTPEGVAASNTGMVSAVLDHGRLDALDEDALQIERFLKGDVRAFDLLYTKYYDKVYAIARGILLDAEEAADTVQEVFTLVHRHLYRFDRRARFSTWLFRIAVNRSIQDSRKRRRRPVTVELMEIAQFDGTEQRQVDPKIHQALGKLRPDDRALLLLYYWEDLTLQEIAETLATNVNATKTRLYRAREKFRALYEREKE
jgi:RNA polymerase sigma-70 factor, ECF subfamily